MTCSRRRIVLPVSACAVLGAMLTVATAWLAASFFELSNTMAYASHGSITHRGRHFIWHTVRPRHLGARQVFVYSVDEPIEAGSPPPSWVFLDDFFAGIHTCGYGVPAVALRRVIVGGSGELYLDDLRGGLDVRISGDTRTLPTFPYWPGFALNTAFYATLAFLLWSTPGFVKRTRRRRRGQCLICGYDLGGIATCPECGH